MKIAAAEDLDVLARTIYGEARGEPWQGQIAVAWVIKNRTKRPQRFGFTVADVCRRPAQFSCWLPEDVNYPLLLAANVEQRSFMMATAAAAAVLSGAIADPTNQADHYYAKSMATPPSWASAMKVTAEIGGHIFLQEQLN